MKSYPLNLVGLERRRCIVIGGGQVSARKAAGLIAAGARPRVIAPSLCPQLAAHLEAEEIEWVPRDFQAEDLAGTFLVIAATNNTALNRQIWEIADRRGVLVNVVDAPAMCNFFVPAVVRRGNFVVGIATGGAAPALSACLRQEMEERYGPEYTTLTEWCAALRPRMRESFPAPEERRHRWQTLVNSPVLAMLTAGQIAEARAWIAANLGEHLAAALSLETPERIP